MKVLVRDRRSGKTTELIRWLLQGHEQEIYPRWTRVIVVPNARIVPYTARMVVAALLETSDEALCMRSLPHLKEHCKDHHELVMEQVRKAVWSLRDLDYNLRGAKSFEYGIDDVDECMYGSVPWRGTYRPTVVTMTGEVVDRLCD